MVPRSVPRNTPGNAPRNRFLEPFAKFTVPSSQVSTCFGGCYWAPYQAPVSGRPQHCFVAVGRAAARLGVDGQVASRVGGAGGTPCSAARMRSPLLHDGAGWRASGGGGMRGV